MCGREICFTMRRRTRAQRYSPLSFSPLNPLVILTPIILLPLTHITHLHFNHLTSISPTPVHWSLICTWLDSDQHYTHPHTYQRRVVITETCPFFQPHFWLQLFKTTVISACHCTRLKFIKAGWHLGFIQMFTGNTWDCSEHSCCRPALFLSRRCSLQGSRLFKWCVNCRDRFWLAYD